MNDDFATARAPAPPEGPVVPPPADVPPPAARTSEPDAAAKLAVALLGFVVFVVLAILLKRGAMSVLTAVFLIGAGIAVSRVVWRGRRGAAKGAEHDPR